jgi:RND family efflux transporter MFP subunit
LIAELDLDQITKQIEEVEISLSLANTVFERQKRLWEQNIGSEIQYLEAENNKKRLEKNLDALQVQMEKGQIYSPISGVVDRKTLGTGELASPGSPIVQLLDVNDLRVEADVPETYLREVQLGETVRVKYPALEMEQNARVSLIGSKIKNANRTFKVEARVSNRNGLLKPNLLAIMYIRDFAVEDAIVVQQELVQQEVSGKDYVLIRDEENGKSIARKIYVTTGQSYNNQVQILEGLEEGAEIIIEGARGLAAGQPIRIQEAKTEARNG